MITFYSIQKPSGVFAFDGEIASKTEKAVQVSTSNGKIWFPKAALTSTEHGYEVAHWFRYNAQQMSVVEPVSRFFNGAM